MAHHPSQPQPAQRLDRRGTRVAVEAERGFFGRSVHPAVPIGRLSQRAIVGGTGHSTISMNTVYSPAPLSLLDTAKT